MSIAEAGSLLDGISAEVGTTAETELEGAAGSLMGGVLVGKDGATAGDAGVSE